MYISLLDLAILVIAAPFASAVGNARVINNCPLQVTLWSVGAAISPPYTLASGGGKYSEPFERDPQTGGKALKVTIEPDGLFNGKPQTVFAYNLNGGEIWYDLNDVFGDAFAGKKVEENSTDTSCATILWPNGVPPAGSQVRMCNSGIDVTLTLCA